jgi:dihydropyrimidinase
MNVDNNIFEGFHVKGKARHVFSRGRMIVEDARFIGEIGAGSFTKSAPFYPVAL